LTWLTNIINITNDNVTEVLPLNLGFGLNPKKHFIQRLKHIAQLILDSFLKKELIKPNTINCNLDYINLFGFFFCTNLFGFFYQWPN